MLTVVPTTAAVPAEADFHVLLASAKATADAVTPYLTQRREDGSVAHCSIQKVASCQHFYTALLRSDGVLLLLTTTTTTAPAANPAAATAAAADPLYAIGACVAAQARVMDSGNEAVVDVAAGASHITYCTASGAVYSCGFDNTYGQLGDGTVWSLAEPPSTAPPLLSTPKRLVGFGDAAAAGGASEAASVSSRPAAPAPPSSASAAAAGAPSSPTRRHVPPPCSRRIRQVACGAHHTLLLTDTGRCVYACGRGDHGELGGARSAAVQPAFRSVPLLFGLEMRQVAAADAHSFVLLRNGLLYAFGDNVCGQLGMGNTKRVLQPTLVPMSGQHTATATQQQQQQQQQQETTQGARRGVLDNRAYASLRAPYDSAESTYYPLRVPRLRSDRADGEGGGGDSVEVAVRAVHCCGSWTLLETDRVDVWLSCGTVLTRGVTAHAAAAGSRLDGCGVLGRQLLGHSKADAYRFLPVLWPALLSRDDAGGWGVEAAAPSWTHRDSNAADAELQSALTPAGEMDGGTGYTHYANGTSEGLAFHDGAAEGGRHRTSDTLLSLCYTKKTIGGVTDGAEARVYPYATSLLVLGEAEEEEGEAGAVGKPSSAAAEGRCVVSRLLVQSGAPAAAAVEMRAADASSWRLVSGTASGIDASRREGGESARAAAPCGASLLKLRSSHGNFIPLRSYALFL